MVSPHVVDNAGCVTAGHAARMGARSKFSEPRRGTSLPPRSPLADSAVIAFAAAVWLHRG